MKVKELIEELNKMPQDLDIIVEVLRNRGLEDKYQEDYVKVVSIKVDLKGTCFVSLSCH